jgi:hypothetical protein
VPIETSRKYFKHELQQNARTKRFFSPWSLAKDSVTEVCKRLSNKVKSFKT